jgi:hypothetical protein
MASQAQADPTCRAALVEEKETTEGGQMLEKSCTVLESPGELDVMEPSGDVHQIRRSLTHNLIGDAQIAALRVPRLRNIHR